MGAKPASLAPQWTHVVYTRDRAGISRIYINGELNVAQEIGGDFAGWDQDMHLALANELTNDRPWLGTFRLVAIYARDLTPEEVGQNYKAPFATGREPLAQAAGDTKRFEVEIAPLLSRQCLECHDTHVMSGGLDLSQLAGALAGGASGPAIVPGSAGDSLLWKRVEADEMPHDRPSLSFNEKAALREWLDGGAAWSIEMIDPAVYASQGGQGVYVQRLTVPEYIETIRSVFGLDVANEARERLPRDVRADGFSNTAYNLNIDLGHVQAYASLAETIAGRVDIRALATKYTQSQELTDENVTLVIEPFGRLLLRGPLTKEEIALYCGISTTVAGSGGDFDDALRHILEAMLQSPRFIYRVERQRGDGTAVPANPYELATRLSYILWGGPPDERLLQAADEQKLDRAGVDAHARRMLQDPQAVERSKQFISEWLDLDRLDSLSPNPAKFPGWSPSLAGDMRAETLAFFEEVAWKQDRPLAELLNAQVTFVTPRLAAHYGLPLEGSSEADALVRYDLTDVPARGGLLTQGSVLTVGGEEASMVSRGLFVMHELLRGVVRDPPPCVDTTPVPSKPGLSQRMISESRISNQTCAGCHTKFEPLAFALERFDGLGAYHERDEYGNGLRDDGHVLFPGRAEPVPYQSAEEFMDLLATSDRVRESLTWKLAQFALGRPLGAADARIVAEINRNAQAAGGTYSSLLTAIVTSELVLLSRTEPAALDAQSAAAEP